MRKPWFRKQNQTWYVLDTATGKQINLGKEEEKAFDKWDALRKATDVTSPDATAAAILEGFLEFSEHNHAAETYAWYGRYLADFGKHIGQDLRVRDLKFLHVTKWLQLEQHDDWGVSSQRAAICSVKAAFGWAADQGILTISPLAKYPLPPANQRETVVERVDHTRIAANTDPEFRLLLVALWHTGARPGEVAKVTAKHVSADGNSWVFRRHKTSNKTRKPRIIYLSPCMVLITKLLVASRPTGPLFLNSRGQPWKKNSIKDRFRRLRDADKLPEGVTAYSYRHAFGTNGLLNGVPLAMVAELMGHSDTRMLSNHYAHLEQRSEQLRDAAIRATRTG